MAKINPDTPTEVRVQPLANGGNRVDVFMPTYSGGIVLTLEVERDADGDWRVTLPTAAELDRSEDGFDIEAHTDHPELISFFNGLSYFGAPDAEYDRLPSTELHTN